MFPFRKILFPVDYSAPCQAVIPYLKEMGRRFSADLTVVHAYGPSAIAYSDLMIENADLAGEAHEREKQRLQQFALETFPDQHVECFADFGEAGSVIREVVQRQGTDLVMLATHG